MHLKVAAEYQGIALEISVRCDNLSHMHNLPRWLSSLKYIQENNPPEGGL